MINVRSVANMVSSMINPNELVTVLLSDGYTIGAGAKQVPKYKTPIVGYAQIQALDSEDLKQLDGLNIQGKIKAAYLYGELAGVVRPNQTGGDIVQRGAENWLIVKVLEGWSTWTKVAIVLQGP